MSFWKKNNSFRKITVFTVEQNQYKAKGLAKYQYISYKVSFFSSGSFPYNLLFYYWDEEYCSSY